MAEQTITSPLYLAIREEGDVVNAYFVLQHPDEPAQSVHIAGISTAVRLNHPELFMRWQALMADIIQELLEGVLDTTVVEMIVRPVADKDTH